MEITPKVPENPFYDQIGGHETFVKLVERFLRGRRHRRGAQAHVPGG